MHIIRHVNHAGRKYTLVVMQRKHMGMAVVVAAHAPAVGHIRMEQHTAKPHILTAIINLAFVETNAIPVAMRPKHMAMAVGAVGHVPVVVVTHTLAKLAHLPVLVRVEQR